MKYLLLLLLTIDPVYAGLKQHEEPKEIKLSLDKLGEVYISAEEMNDYPYEEYKIKDFNEEQEEYEPVIKIIWEF